MDSFGHHYTPLSQVLDEIRILEVQPGIGKDMLSCKMFRISLNEPSIPFETISYCWGPSRPPVDIRLNGRVVSVTASSEAALRCMRLPDGVRVLWIDAICINQASDAEKSQQVSLMSEIYSSASRNLVWLGEDSGMAVRAARAVNEIYAEMREETGNLERLFETIWISREVQDSTCYSIRSADAGFRGSPDLEALATLFELNFFRRLWIVQEVVLARSNLAHWGSVQLDLLPVVRVARWLSFKQQYISERLDNCSGLPCAIEIFNLFDSENGVSRKSMWELFGLSQRFITSEPRDSIFALLGLVRKYQPTTTFETLLAVDYTKPIIDILCDATRYAVCQLMNLWPLQRVSYSHLDDDLDVIASNGFPTWVVRPDLARDVNDSVMFSDEIYSCGGLGLPQTLLDLSHGIRVLIVEGFVADIVEAVTATYDEPFSDNVTGCYKWLKSVKAFSSRACPLLSSEDLLSVLSAGWDSMLQRARSSNTDALVAYLRRLNPEAASISEDHVEHKLREEAEEIRKLETITWNPDDGLNTFSFCSKRRFLVTLAGRAGLGPRCVIKGDVVTILRGSNMPMILRPFGNGYRLAGPAYVHGIMNGEAVKAFQELNEPLTTFHLY